MKEKSIPMRRCIGCMESKEKNQLIRIAGYEGTVSVDLTGRAKGRGAYLCKGSQSCLNKAYKKKALERSLHMTVTQQQLEQVEAELKALNDKNEG